MTTFQFTQSHIDTLAAAGVKWAYLFDDINSTPRPLDHLKIKMRGLTPRGLLVGTATDLLEKMHGRGRHVQLFHSESVSYADAGFSMKHPTQEENLIDMIVDLSAQLKVKETPPVTLETLNERLERIEKKVGV